MNNRLNYNPDVLSCLANLSNDEVFTPPQLANQMLDMLPQELFQSSKTKFLDPCTKSTDRWFAGRDSRPTGAY